MKIPWCLCGQYFTLETYLLHSNIWGYHSLLRQMAAQKQEKHSSKKKNTMAVLTVVHLHTIGSKRHV